MNILKMTSVPLVTALFFGTALAGSSLSHAGFQTGQPSSSYTTATAAPLQPADTEMDGTSVGQPTKVFEVYNERYVPDSIRKKYNLDDSWFEKNNPPEKNYVDTYPVNEPVSITPMEAAAPAAPVTPAAPSAPMRARAPVEVKAPVESWRGRKGENIHDVMQRWAARTDTQLMWASADTPTLQKDFTFVGKFQDAVNELIRLEGGNKIHSQYRSEGLNPVMMTPASTVTTSAAPSAEVALAEEKKLMENPLAQVFQPKQVKQEKPETRWFALSGAPLAEVVRVWADDAGVAVIWQSERNFAVKESISQVGYFEDAVFRAFNQYSDEEIRPVGEMYRDPQSGQQVLLVRTDVK